MTVKPMMNTEMCPRCGGDGKTIVDWESYLRGRHDESDVDEFVEECPDCNGTGRRPRPFKETPDAS